MIKSELLVGLIIIAAGASLSACHKARESDASASLNFGTGSDRPEDQFGKGFGEKFRADPKSKPTNVQDDDVNPVSLTAEPIPIK
jgi:hypothetical protein